MQSLPNFGDKVQVRPAPGLNVQDGADRFGVFLPPQGGERIWDEWWHRRALDGSIMIETPNAGA